MEQISFEELYVSWYSRVKHYTIGYVLDEADAENITQDAFLALYERREFLDKNINIVAYLFTCVKNRCLDYLHKKIIERKSLDKIQSEIEMELQLKYNSLESFDINISSNEDESIETLIHKALQKLPPECRKIFIMSKLYHKKQQQIAIELNISLNTVETQMGIAYKKLRIELKDYIPLLLFLFLK